MLEASVQGSTANPPLITWSKSDGTAQDITGYTITGRLFSIERRTARAITGTFDIVDPTDGIFRWNRSTVDLAQEGMFEVQFIGTAATVPNITYSSLWQVLPAR
jgi:hypothetical protein